MSRPRLDPYIPLILLLSVFAVAPLTAPGFFLNAHDATIGAYFLWQFDASIADGAWWPVWAADMVYGYGHPLFLIIAPLPYYLAEAFLLLGRALAGGNPIAWAIKAVYALAMLGSGLTMYAYARRWLGREGGLVAAVAYVYIPFHLVDIYVRADLAEYVALALFPAMLWAVDRTLDAGDRAGRARGAAALAGDLRRPGADPLYHGRHLRAGGGRLRALAGGVCRWSEVRWPPGSAPWRAGWRRRRRAWWPGLALAGVFVVPVLAELRYLDAGGLAGGYFSYSRHFVYLSQFFSPFWGYGYAGEGPGDQMPYQLGAVPVVLALLALAGVVVGVERFVARCRRAPDRADAIPQMSGSWPGLGARTSVRSKRFSASAPVSRPGAARPPRSSSCSSPALFLFLMMAVSQPLWDLLRPVVSFIQFPWRLLVVTSLTMAFLSGAIVRGAPRLAPVLVLILVLASYAYTTPQHTGSECLAEGHDRVPGRAAFRRRPDGIHGVVGSCRREIAEGGQGRKAESRGEGCRPGGADQGQRAEAVTRDDEILVFGRPSIGQGLGPGGTRLRLPPFWGLEPAPQIRYAIDHIGSGRNSCLGGVGMCRNVAVFVVVAVTVSALAGLCKGQRFFNPKDDVSLSAPERAVEDMTARERYDRSLAKYLRCCKALTRQAQRVWPYRLER